MPAYDIERMDHWIDHNSAGMRIRTLLIASLGTLALLFEVDARDPAIFAAVGFAMTLVALAASYVPARRAASADPLVVLRAD